MLYLINLIFQSCTLEFKVDVLKGSTQGENDAEKRYLILAEIRGRSNEGQLLGQEKPPRQRQLRRTLPAE